MVSVLPVAMSQGSVQGALAPLLNSARVLGVRGWPSEGADRVYGVALISTLALLATSGLSCILDFLEASMKFYNCGRTIMNIAEGSAFSLTIVSCFPLINFIMKRGNVLQFVYIILEMQCRNLRCEIKFFCTLKKFALLYSISAWLVYAAFICMQFVAWSDVGPEYMRLCLATTSIRFLQAMVDGQMLMIIQTKKLLFHHINGKLEELVPDEYPDILAQLTRLRESHASLCALDEHVNSVFGSLQLINVTTLIFDLVINSYFLVVMALGLADDLRESLVQFLVCYNVSNTLSYLRLLLLTRIPHNTKLQAQRTQNVLRKFEFISNKKNTREEISLFTTQLLLCGAPRYSVLGIFPLDLSLLTSVHATVATYMVILMQFHTAAP